MMQAKEKMTGQFPDMGSSSSAPAADWVDSRAAEEGNVGKGHASEDANTTNQTQRLSLSALVTEARRLTSALAKVSLRAASLHGRLLSREFWHWEHCLCISRVLVGSSGIMDFAPAHGDILSLTHTTAG